MFAARQEDAQLQLQSVLQAQAQKSRQTSISSYLIKYSDNVRAARVGGQYGGVLVVAWRLRLRVTLLVQPT